MRGLAAPRPATLLTTLLWVAALSGCSAFKSNVVETQVYLLQPTAAAEAATASSAPPGSLSVQMPVAAPGLETDRIVLTRAGGRLDYFAAASWADRLPQVLQRVTIDALRARGAFGAVQSDAAPFNTDFTLQIEVRRFAAEYADTGAPTVHVVLDCTLGRRSDRGILTSFTAEASVPAGDNRLGAVIEAFDRAAGMALQQIVERTRIGS
jgi:cholesterol transport system auxiliary component